jgi:1-acyl-sn-glycerol-3-phosphate acyltransferase
VEDFQLKPARDHGLPLTQRLKSTRREGGLIDTIAQVSARTLVRGYLRVWHRVTHEGLENLPASCPLVMVANHTSHLDSVVMAAALPWRLRRTVFPLAAGDIFFETPVISVFSAVVINALPMWRQKVGRHAMDDLRTRLVEDTCGYILFPEGRLSNDGALQPFKAGLGMLVAGTRVPVVPCYIRGAFDALPRNRALPRPRKITLRVGPPLMFADVENDRDGWRTVVERVEGAIRGLGGLPPAVSCSSPE